MKWLFLTISLINLCLLPAYGFCLLSIENGGHKYFVSIWKHSEDNTSDFTDPHRFYGEKQLSPIDGILSSKKGVRMVFNDGVFTSMNYMEGETKRWAGLSRAEKDMVFYIQEKFDVTEK